MGLDRVQDSVGLEPELFPFFKEPSNFSSEEVRRIWFLQAETVSFLRRMPFERPFFNQGIQEIQKIFMDMRRKIFLDFGKRQRLIF